MNVSSTSSNPLQTLLNADPSASASQKKMQLLRQQQEPLPPVLGAPQGGGNSTGLSFGAIDPEAAKSGLPIGNQLDPGAAPDTPLTVDGLLEAWGRSDSAYDLDGSGTVNMQDLVSLLAQLSQAANPGGGGNGNTGTGEPGAFENEVPSGPGENTEPALTLEGLLEAWGDKGSEYDLDGSGTVGMSDLVELLSRLSAENGAGGQGGGVGSLDALGGAARTTDIFQGEGGVLGNGLTVEGLLDAWGERGSEYDLNSDGTVGMEDLVALLSQMSQDANEAGAKVGPPQERGSLNARDSKDDVGRIAKRLVSNFHDNGFTKHPPENLHQILDSLNLPDAQARGVFDAVQQSYPRGLGLSIIG